MCRKSSFFYSEDQCFSRQKLFQSESALTCEWTTFKHNLGTALNVFLSFHPFSRYLFPALSKFLTQTKNLNPHKKFKKSDSDNEMRSKEQEVIAESLCQGNNE